ncbi:MAG TPA: ferredoxin, partial [Methyloversatilis sp.]
SCAIEVTILERKTPMGMHLTEKEKVVLKLSGRINATQIADAETRDIPPPWRLACQFIVRDEDILVKF